MPPNWMITSGERVCDQLHEPECKLIKFTYEI